MSDLRKAAQDVVTVWKMYGTAESLRGWMEILEAALATPAPHGCHVDLEDGVEPDGCVLDEGKPMNCIYAMRLHREGKDKTACEYWKPIEVKK